MNTSMILLRSVGLALVVVLGMGYYGTELGSANIDDIITSDERIKNGLQDALMRLSRTKGGTLEMKGLRVEEGTIMVRRELVGQLEARASDYRFDEFMSDKISLIPTNSVVFECESEILECKRDMLDVVKSGRVDARVACAPQGKQLSCKITITDSTSTKAVLPESLGAYDFELHRDIVELIKDVTAKIKDRVSKRTPIIDTYTGRASEDIKVIIFSIAKMGVTLNLLGKSELDLEIKANEKYGIPFVDGSTSLEQHVQFLTQKIKQIRPPSSLEKPTLKQMVETPFGIDNIGFLLPIQRTAFDQTLTALAYTVVYPTYTRNINAIYYEIAKPVYEKRFQGSLKDQAMRLRFVKALQELEAETYIEEKEQRLANAILWIESHPNLSEVALEETLNEGDAITAKDVSAKSKGQKIFFSLREEYLADRIEVLENQVTAKGIIRFYWIVQKDAVKNQYNVIISRQPKVEEQEWQT